MALPSRQSHFSPAAPIAAFGQTPANVARNKTLIVAAQVEAPVYRNVGQANPYSINNEDFRVSIINMFEPLFYYNSNKNEVIPWIAAASRTRRIFPASP